MPVLGSRAKALAALVVASLIVGCATQPLVSPSDAPPSPSASPGAGSPNASPTSGATSGATPAGSSSPSATPVAGWLALAQAPDAGAAWSVDAQHLLVWLGTPGAPPESFSVRVIDRSGTLVQSHEAVTEPVWLDERRFIAYRLDWQQDEAGDWFAQTGPNGERLGSALIGEIGSAQLTEAAGLPLDPAISNGRGALALTGFASGGDAEFAVWADGELTAWRPGYPSTWSAPGDRLAVIHARDSGPAAEGWLEVVAWPGLDNVWSSDEQVRIGSAAFDPTGGLVAFPEFAERPTPPRQVPEFDLTVRIADLGSGELGGFTALENGSFAWLAGDRMVVVGFDSSRATVYDLAGSVLATEDVAGPNVVSAANGAVLLFYDGELDEPPMQVMRADSFAVLESPGTLAGPPPAMAPDGSAIVVVARLPSAQPGGPPATVLLHPL